MSVTPFHELFHKALLERLGFYENLGEIEVRSNDLRSGRQITYADLLKISDESLWPFNNYWAWPAEKQVEEGLKRTEGLLSPDKISDERGEKDTIVKLNAIFKNIALVSILLRFVYPERYGIYSLPVLQVSKTERGKNEVDDYINYLNKLRTILSIVEIRDKYRVERIADVDMLLLAVSELGNDILEEFISIFISNYHPVQKYLIQFSKEFEKSINKCDKTIKGRVLEGIIHLEKSPLFEIGDTIKPLKNDAKKRWRYRFGDYRLVYFPDEGRRIVILLDFGPRKDIYRE